MSHKIGRPPSKIDKFLALKLMGLGYPPLRGAALITWIYKHTYRPHMPACGDNNAMATAI